MESEANLLAGRNCLAGNLEAKDLEEIMELLPIGLSFVDTEDRV